MYFKYVDAISAQRIIRSVPIEKTDLFNQQMQSARRGNMGGMYIILYNEICESLKKEIFEDVIMEKYGFKGVRIVRLLYEKGKLDEKAVKARQKLTELMSGGFVQIQEVPRSADRAPSRTFYLWDIDYKKCYDHQRLLEKKEKEDALRQLNKSSNIQLLNETERKKLHELEQILTQLDTVQLRTVQNIMLFRKYK
ncbi:hypothetical protein RhiirA4_390145 [Rhizophagus irregularis]|uniref:DNA-directed RNA polymerase III subunit RPC3 n=1 Tax=Rhizophagus irregularis TaxID=588596 RepID=A0A2I1FSB8_9GLOM|nr:hypothetical protein RhiirA4_390145 [Rhizophagus irregularis]